MKIGLFADIHANREALQACLAHAEQARVDRHVFLGDLVGYGPDPEWVVETISRYRDRGALAVLGNHDEAVLQERPDKAMQQDAQTVISWTRSRLHQSHLDLLASLPFSATQGDQLYVHANPWTPENWDYVLDGGDVGKALQAAKARIIFLGHLHKNALYHRGATGSIRAFRPVPGVEIPLSPHRRWLAVVGSVGQPRDENPAGSYAVFDAASQALTYHRVPFEVESTAAKIRRHGLPEWLAARLEMGV